MNKELKRRYESMFYTLIGKVKRPGWDQLIFNYNELIKSPCSINYHLNIEGGLLIHSVNLYIKFKQRLLELKENINEESIIISCLMHDLCKVGAYIKKGDKYIYNNTHPKGHAKLSLERIREYIELKPLEEDLIKYHMGIFGVEGKVPEYSSNDLLSATQNNYLIQVFASCDMECSKMEDLM